MQGIYVTKEGYEKLQGDLARLRTLKQELSLEIGEAMAQGDLRENAGYTYAKEKQAETLSKITELEAKLRNAKIIDDMQVDKTRARIGATVTVKDTAKGVELTYTLAGSEEADPMNGSISVDSPLAIGILGKKTGDEFSVVLPVGEKKYRLISLEYK
ncbi:MAG: transcription elongation factor GreA [Elusimicrobiaceae bacterium]|nr:transcription elongation factor GreA [Elusimicrobiaceae bacterium]